MAYRVYLLEHDGRVVSETPLVCSDDVEASKQAKHFIGRYVIELWNGDRLIIRLQPKSKEA